MGADSGPVAAVHPQSAFAKMSGAPEQLKAESEPPSSTQNQQHSSCPLENGATSDQLPSSEPGSLPQVGSGSDVSNPSNPSKIPASTSLPPEILGLYSRTDGRRGKDLTATSPRTQEAAAGSGGLHSEDDRSQPGINSLTAGEAPRDHMVVEPLWGPTTLDSCPVIMVPKNFAPKEGTKLTDDLIVGKHISSGLQGGVYDLTNLDGSKANMVFKIVHAHAPLAEVEREWEVGMRLNQLAEMDGSLPGFMGVGAGIRGGGRFRGMLLERLHGRTVNKVICTRDFHDVNYVHSMLYSIFSALDRAQGALGFHHSDLRLANVMEIIVPDDVERQALGGIEATLAERQLSMRMLQLSEQPTDKDPELVRDTLRHQFKIIDYGLAIFDETFAAGPDVVIEDERDPVASRRSINLQRQQSISPATGCAASFQFPMMKKDQLGDLPSTSAIEKLYRYMWRHKGDVYHLVFELGEWLDGRVWPSSDELDVLRLVDFVEHVTGVRMRYWFSDETSGEDSVGGWRDQACGPFERHDSAMHFLRRWSVRLRSWINPSNPGVTAAEALTAPFFTKRISLRGIIHGCSMRYSRWTKAPKRGNAAARAAREQVKMKRKDIQGF